MMHECKRLLNDSTSDGLLFPGRCATGIDATVSHMLAVPRAVTPRYIERAELPRKGGPESFLLKVDVYQHFASYYALSFSTCRCCDKRQLPCRTWGRSANAPTSTKARRRTNTPPCRTHISRIFGAHAASRASLCASSQLGACAAARSKFLRTALPTSAAPMHNGPRHHAFQKSSNIAQSTSVSAKHGFRARLRQVLLLQLAHLPRLNFSTFRCPGTPSNQPHFAKW